MQSRRSKRERGLLLLPSCGFVRCDASLVKHVNEEGPELHRGFELLLHHTPEECIPPAQRRPQRSAPPTPFPLRCGRAHISLSTSPAGSSVSDSMASVDSRSFSVGPNLP